MNVGLKIARTRGYFFLLAAKWVGCLEFADSSCGFLSGCKRGLFTERVETKGYMLARHLKSSATAGGDLLDQLAEKRCLISFFSSFFFFLFFFFFLLLLFLSLSHFSPIPGPYYHIHRFQTPRDSVVFVPRPLRLVHLENRTINSGKPKIWNPSTKRILATFFFFSFFFFRSTRSRRAQAAFLDLRCLLCASSARTLINSMATETTYRKKSCTHQIRFVHVRFVDDSPRSDRESYTHTHTRSQLDCSRQHEKHSRNTRASCVFRRRFARRRRAAAPRIANVGRRPSPFVVPLKQPSPFPPSPTDE